MCYPDCSASFPRLKRRKTYETRLPCRYISSDPILRFDLSRKLEALIFTTFIFLNRIIHRVRSRYLTSERTHSFAALTCEISS